MSMVTRSAITAGFVGSILVPALTTQFSPDILVDRYLLRAERLIATQNYEAALAALDNIVSLQEGEDIALPTGFFFVYAQTALLAGSIEVASESVTRYLTLAGRSGEFYTAALKLLDEAEGAAHQRELEAAARRQAEAEEARRLAETRRADEARRLADARRLGPVAFLFVLGSSRYYADDFSRRCPRLRFTETLDLANLLIMYGEWIHVYDARGNFLYFTDARREGNRFDDVCEYLPDLVDSQLVETVEAVTPTGDPATPPVIFFGLRESGSGIKSIDLRNFVNQCPHVEVTPTPGLADFFVVGDFFLDMYDRDGILQQTFTAFRKSNKLKDMCNYLTNR